MDSLDRDRIRAWLAAESTGEPDAADRAFARVMADLPRLEPSRRFVPVLMARLRVADAAPAGLWANWWVRSAIASSMVLLGGVVGTLSWQAAFDAAVGTVRNVAGAVDWVLAGCRAGLDAAGSLWAAVAHAGTVMAGLILTPGPGLFVMLNLLIAAGALAALQRLLVTQERR